MRGGEGRKEGGEEREGYAWRDVMLENADSIIERAGR